MRKLTLCERQIIEALGIYRYLTLKHMVTLGIAKTVDTPRKAANGLACLSKPLVRKFPQKESPTRGKLQYVYSLNERGADAAAELLGVPRADIQFVWTNNTPQFKQYDHIMGLIDIHIAVRQWADGNNHLVAMFNNRLAFTGSNRTAGEQALTIKTKVPLTGQTGLVPDTVLTLMDSVGKPQLLSVEYERGGNTAKAIGKILAYCHAIGSYAIHEKFHFSTERDPLILYVTDTEGEYKAIISRMRRIEGFAEYLPLFRFKTLEAFKADFLGNWHGADIGQPVPLYTPEPEPEEEDAPPLVSHVRTAARAVIGG